MEKKKQKSKKEMIYLEEAIADFLDEILRGEQHGRRRAVVVIVRGGWLALRRHGLQPTQTSRTREQLFTNGCDMNAQR